MAWCVQAGGDGDRSKHIADTEERGKLLENSPRRVVTRGDDLLTKLIRTKADKHILFLERDQFLFFPQLLYAELARQRPKFPLLNDVDEIWLLETIFYDTEGVVMFERCEGDSVVASMTFVNGDLVGRSKDGMPVFD